MARTDYETPSWLVRRVEQHLGLTFTLDAAASAVLKKAPEYFGLDHTNPACRDALAFAHWCAHPACCSAPVVWGNFPYTTGHPIEPWVERCGATARSGGTVVALLPSSRCTNWWHTHVIGHAAEVIDVRGRVSFLLDGEVGTRPMHEVVLVVWRPGVPPPLPHYGVPMSGRASAAAKSVEEAA